MTHRKEVSNKIVYIRTNDEHISNIIMLIKMSLENAFDALLLRKMLTVACGHIFGSTSGDTRRFTKKKTASKIIIKRNLRTWQQSSRIRFNERR